MSTYDYDLLVIGSGPGGQRAAVQASKLDKRVAVVERKAVLGGVCVNLGTIPSKTLREAVLYLSGYRERAFYGDSYRVKQSITMADLVMRTEQVTKNEIDVTRGQLHRNRIDVLYGTASFLGPNSVRIDEADGHTHQDITASVIVIATGTEATRESRVAFDGKCILTSDEVFCLPEVPRSLAVIGAGVIGCEYASIFAALGTRVTLIDKRDRLLPFLDEEIADRLENHMRDDRITLRLREEVGLVDVEPGAVGPDVRIHLASGKTVHAEHALYAIGRTGATSKLNLAAAGLATDDRGRIAVNAQYQTRVPNIYAVGDVIGFPALASTSMEQGRLAACHAFGVAASSAPELFPYGIYSIPEISMVGKNEEELSKACVPYEVGKAMYKEIARGQIIGDTNGMLKLIFHAETREILGVHIIGEGASELVHIGQAVMSFQGKLDYFIHNVFNYPTLAECYKTAAYDGMNRLGLTLT
jgi:NAD(P) transhydrogenase